MRSGTTFVTALALGAAAGTAAFLFLDSSSDTLPIVTDNMEQEESFAGDSERGTALPRESGTDNDSDANVAVREHAKLEKRLSEETAENVRLKQEIESLKAETGRVSKAAGNTDAGGLVQAHNATSALPFDFGGYDKVAELANADWKALAGNSASFRPLLEEVALRMRGGESPTPDLIRQISELNTKAGSFAHLPMKGKLPTNIEEILPVGELLHPFFLANLMAKHLEQAQLPMSADQLDSIQTLGQEYEQAWQKAQVSYSENTLTVEKTLDELELKRAFSDKSFEVLSEDQRNALTAPINRHYRTLDVYSPVGMFVAYTLDQRFIESREEARKDIENVMKSRWGLDDARIKASENAIRLWLEAVEPLLAAEPAVPEVARWFHIDQATTALKAQLAAMKEVLAVSGVTDESRGLIIGDTRMTIFLPVKEVKSEAGKASVAR
ncbi:MAG: hypothetical protein HUU29_13400 [Planctomycetaceae bacterium]|nr:hypothetical protein [Planctomycetaceae bacterium]